VTKKLDEIPYLANHRAEKRDDKIVIEPTSEANAPCTRVMVLARGQIIFTGSVNDFENSNLPEVTRLTEADNGTVFSDYVTSDPWDKRRQPRERVL
jgi:ABC-type multidrug transport system ATPase subunit